MDQPTTLLKALGHLRQYIFLSNVIFTVGPILVRLLFELSYESYLFMPNGSLFSYAVSFDGLQYLSNAYLWEKNYAFLPGYVTFIRIVKAAIQCITIHDNANAVLVVVLVVVNKVLTAVSAAYLYRIAWKITDSLRVALAAAFLFIFNPSTIFYHSVYTEPMYCCVTFIAIFTLLDTKERWMQSLDRPFSYFVNCGSSLLLMSIAVSIRSTAMFLSLIPGLPLLTAFWASLKTFQFARFIKIGIVGASTLLILMGGFIAYIYYGYWQFCSLQPKSWFCADSIPNVYSAVQDKFWSVGFLKGYYTQQNVMTLFGVGSVVCALMTVSNDLYKRQFELCISYWILLFVTICYSNLLSSARFFSSHPIYIINMALFLSQDKRASPSFKQSLVVFYLVLYNVFGIVFFSLRLPWT